MKNLKGFNNFLKESSEPSSGNYLRLEPVPNGLWIHLTPEGRQELLEISDENPTEDNFVDLFDDIRGNSEYTFISDLGEAGFGLTDAPGILDGYFPNDDGQYEATDDTAEVYYYDDYMISDFVKILQDEGKVKFSRA